MLQSAVNIHRIFYYQPDKWKCDLHHIFYVFQLYFILRGCITSADDERGNSSYLWSTKIYLYLAFQKISPFFPFSMIKQYVLLHNNQNIATKAGIAFTQGGGVTYNAGVNFEW